MTGMIGAGFERFIGDVTHDKVDLIHLCSRVPFVNISQHKH